MSATPVYRPGLYTRKAIVDPYPHYRRMRALGPVVWSARHRVYALPRYAECKATLRDDALFASDGGVALNPLSNRLSNGTTLASDGEEHARRRKLVAHRLMPRALRDIGDEVDRQASTVVDRAVARGSVVGGRMTGASCNGSAAGGSIVSTSPRKRYPRRGSVSM